LPAWSQSPASARACRASAGAAGRRPLGPGRKLAVPSTPQGRRGRARIPKGAQKACRHSRCRDPPPVVPPRPGSPYLKPTICRARPCGAPVPPLQEMERECSARGQSAWLWHDARGQGRCPRSTRRRSPCPRAYGSFSAPSCRPVLNLTTSDTPLPPFVLSGEQSTVYVDLGPADKPRAIRQQKRHGIGNILRRAQPA